MDNTYVNVGKNLKHLRKIRKITVRQLAVLINLPSSTIAYYEQYGCSIEKSDKIDKFADFYGIKKEILDMNYDDFISEIAKNT